MMKNSLQLKLSQQLTMTPQLQQAIRLLQLSTVELCQEIQNALENNPLLEVDDHYAEISVVHSPESEQIDTSIMMENKNIPDDIPLDASLDDIYTAGTPSGTHSDYYNEELPVYQGETHQTLYEYLMWQLNLTPFTEQDRAIAISIIQSIDESGYLTTTIEDILEDQNNPDIELAEVEAVLKRIQHFDPVGVGARNLQECMLLQINQLMPINDDLQICKTLITHHLDLLGQKDYKSLIKKLNITQEQLKNAILLIQELQPYPGQSINTEPPDYVIPDILVKKVGKKWQIIINNDALPNLRINQSYAAMEKKASESDSQYIRQALQEANWLIRSIENRNDTLTKVSQFIVEHQQNFFELGEEYMKPMILADIAQAINMHESTISRVTTQKYLQCPRGVFELKYFFSNKMNAESGEETSAIAIKALIKKLIINEDSKKPLSDSKIASLLEEKGMLVARRTVAKYRESLLIPPSNQRKELK